jgi:hypothetical protein
MTPSCSPTAMMMMMMTMDIDTSSPPSGGCAVVTTTKTTKTTKTTTSPPSKKRDRTSFAATMPPLPLPLPTRRSPRRPRLQEEEQQELGVAKADAKKEDHVQLESEKATVERRRPLFPSCRSDTDCENKVPTVSAPNHRRYGQSASFMSPRTPSPRELPSITSTATAGLPQKTPSSILRNKTNANNDNKASSVMLKKGYEDETEETTTTTATREETTTPNMTTIELEALQYRLSLLFPNDQYPDMQTKVRTIQNPLLYLIINHSYIATSSLYRLTFTILSQSSHVFYHV